MLIILNNKGTEVDLERIVIDELDLKKDSGIVSLTVDKFNIGWFRKLYVSDLDYDFISSVYLTEGSTILNAFGENLIVINLGNKSKDKDLFINNSNVNIVDKNEDKVCNYIDSLLCSNIQCKTYTPLEV